MALRIICLEEHVIDAELAAAVGPLAAKDAPYYAGLGTRLEEAPSQHDRPMMEGPHEAVRLAGAPIDVRLRDMDANAIDMQVLSFTQPIQLLPAAQADELARRANDRLAAREEQRRGGPSRDIRRHRSLRPRSADDAALRPRCSTAGMIGR